MPSRLSTLSPAYFAFVMANGIVSIGAEIRGFHAFALVLVWIGVAGYAALVLLNVMRLISFRSGVMADLLSHQRGAGFLTLVAGTNVLGSQLALVAHRTSPAVVLWWVGLVLWTLLLYGFVAAVTFAEEKPDLSTGLSGVWLLLVVSTESVAVLGTIVGPRIGDHGVLFVALLAHLIGAMLYMVLIGLIFYRWTFFKMQAEQATPPYWINMGALAITTLAGSALIGAASRWDLLADLIPFLKGSTLLFWAFATWWLPLLVIVGIWRHAVRHVPLTYDPSLWAIVFPLGMYSVATAKMFDAVGLTFGSWIAVGFFWIATAAWAATLAGMVKTELASRASGPASLPVTSA